jgi:hypothetical protein
MVKIYNMLKIVLTLEVKWNQISTKAPHNRESEIKKMTRLRLILTGTIDIDT